MLRATKVQGFAHREGYGFPVIVTTFPRTVRVIEHTLIPSKDGTTLTARKI